MNSEDWREVRLGELVAQGALMISDGYRVRNEELGPEGIPFVRGGDIRDGWIDTSTVDHIRPEFADRVQAKLARSGDVAFITKGTVGRAGRLQAGQPTVVFAPQVAYWRVLDTEVLDPGYVFYVVRSHQFQSALDGVKTHGAMAADYVSISLQHDFSFTFPDIETQRSIARVLGSLDEKIEHNRRMSHTLESIARAMFKFWFVDFDPVCKKMEGKEGGEVGLPLDVAALFPSSLDDSPLGRIPAGWDVAPCDREFRITMGQSPPGTSYNEEGEGLPFFQGCRDFGSRYPTRRVFCTAPSRFADSGDTLVSVRAPVGRVNQSTERCCIGRGLAGVRHRLDVPCYTFESMRSLAAAFRDFDSGGTVFGSIGGKDFANLRVLVPPRPLLEAYEKTVEPLLQLVAKNEEASTTLAATRETILPPLLTGSWSGGQTAG